MAEKRLTTEIAEQFLQGEGIRPNYQMQYFTELDDEAAEILRGSKRDLRLGGLKSLSDAAAESLSRHDAAFWWYSGGITTF